MLIDSNKSIVFISSFFLQCKILTIKEGIRRTSESEIISLDRFLDSAPALDSFSLKASRYTLVCMLSIEYFPFYYRLAH